MCGIFCVVNSAGNNCDNLINQLKFETNIKRRGPDSFNFQVVPLENVSLGFAASVLWLQGSTISQQPIEDEHSVFCYNGDIFSGFDENLQKEHGDTNLFHSFVKNQINHNSLDNLCQVQGPYAFIIFNKCDKKVYFGRDIFGRRSLLMGKNEENDTFIISSVAKRNAEFKFIELPSIGIFSLNLWTKEFEVQFWPFKNHNFYSKLKELETFLGIKIKMNVHPIEKENGQNGEHGFVENDNFLLLKNLKIPKEFNDIFITLLQNSSWQFNVNSLKVLLENAIFKRISNLPPYCSECIKTQTSCNHATTGILFSGGVDCAILAVLLNKYVDNNRPIDLLNVSFDSQNNYQSPDRIVGMETLKELQSCCPTRVWNFVEINVTKEELDLERDRHIADLIYPLNTILDDSLGCALWFASRGQGNEYTSSSRILIVGMGADELFGGYSRHRAAFRRLSFKGLQESLDDDWMNLPYRNLGRDDRVISDNSRQLRTPYLDENVVNFLRNLECWEKTYPSDKVPQGVGEKILLRCLAYDLGLKNACTLKKRALQFGSRIAIAKENAHDKSPRLNF
ncbi:hypothetical protein ABEB36_003417 [Hypothenemus hampei]|uniref:Glutamine amidotransferase type-2 domain-containing protein n=1 Tax=Hypothenemus hampei TaxID=57062 RepID=A0ABD1FAX6_HYPHA